MYNQTPYGVRRSRSFDSYDNLERWQAIREHRKQFLSTRAKFDKIPPSEPPPPPPRHESKFRIINRSPSSSAVSQLIQNFSEDVKKKKALNKGNYSSFHQKQSAGSRFTQPEVKNVSASTNVSEHSTVNNLPKVHRFTNENEEETFRALESPGSILKITQSWQKYKIDQSDKVINLKSIQQPPTMTIISQEERPVEAVNEPPIIKNTVNRLGYEQPTSFKDISIKTTTFENPINCTIQNNSNLYASSMLSSDFVDAEEEHIILPSTSEIGTSLPGISTEIVRMGHTNTEQNGMHVSNFVKSSMPKDDLHKKVPFHKVSEKQKFNTQEDRRIYLDSILKMFESDVQEQELSNDKNNNNDIGLYNQDNNYQISSSDSFTEVKPRRISTGSMHEPNVWRTQPPVNPGRILLNKYSNLEVRK